jgi:hypothetical protein
MCHPQSLMSLALAASLVSGLATHARAQVNNDLHVVRAAPRGDAVVIFSKPLPLSAELVTPSFQTVHTGGFTSTQANNIAVVLPRAALNSNFRPSNPVKVCDRDNIGNYVNCSQLVTIASGPTLTGDRWALSLQNLPRVQQFLLDAGSAFGGRDYLLLGTLTGTSGFTHNSLLIPLNPDAYFFFTLNSPNTFPLSNSSGRLDSSGFGGASFTLPPGLPAAAVGLTLQHAFVVLDTTGVVAVSNPFPVTLVP